MNNGNEKFTRFTLRLEENQVKKLRILEEKYSMSRAEILRKIIDTEFDRIDYLILEKQELKDSIKKLAFELNKIGVVINQANHNFYNNKNVKIEEVQERIDELWQLLKVLKE